MSNKWYRNILIAYSTGILVWEDSHACRKEVFFYVLTSVFDVIARQSLRLGKIDNITHMKAAQMLSLKE